MLIAQTETVGRVVDVAAKSASDYGLIGVLLVLVLAAIGTFVMLVFRFTAPLLRDLVASTCELHTSIKDTNLRLSITLDQVTKDHGDKLTDIRDLLTSRQSPIPPVGGV